MPGMLETRGHGDDDDGKWDAPRLPPLPPPAAAEGQQQQREQQHEDQQQQQQQQQQDDDDARPAEQRVLMTLAAAVQSSSDETGECHGDGHGDCHCHSYHEQTPVSPSPATSATPSSPLLHFHSRSPSPDISFLDGTPHYLFLSTLPPRPRSRSPLSSMIALPVRPPDHGSVSRQDLRLPKPSPSPSVLNTPSSTLEARVGQVAMAPIEPDSQDLSRPRISAVPVPSEQIPTHPTVAISEILELLRLQRYHRRKTRLAQENLFRLQTAAARTTRLACAAPSVQHTFAECIRLEDKISFANLLNAFHDSSDACFFPDEATTQEVEADPIQSVGPGKSFLTGLSLASRTSILELLVKLRYDGTFVANRLASLSQREVLALLPDQSNSRSNESIFGGISRTSSRTSRPLGFLVDSQVDALASQGFGSPLETLIYAPRSISKTDLAEEELSIGVWAQACGKLISGQKPGSEKVVPAILDIFANGSPWPGKERLEMWILQILERGAFLLEQPAKQTFRARMEGRNDSAAADEARMEAFFSQAVESLLDLIAEPTGPSIVPPGALRLSWAIHSCLQISPNHQRVFPQFVLVRWLFSSFLMDAIVVPEAHGILTDHYLPDPARQRILMEVARRCQRIVFDVTYSWKYGNTVASQLVQRVHAVMGKFQVYNFHPAQQHGPTEPPLAEHVERRQSEDFLAISATDVVTIINALCPRRRPESISSDHDHFKSGVQSSASSISGFSLFGSTRPAEVPDTLSAWPPEQHVDAEIPSENSHKDGDDLITDDGPIQDACIELEDLVSNRLHPSRHYWDILIARSATDALCSVQDRWTELMTQKSGSTGGQQGASVTPNPDLTKILNESPSSQVAVEALLQHVLEYESRLPSHEYEFMSSQHDQVQALFDQTIRLAEDYEDYVSMHRWHLRRRDYLASASPADSSRFASTLLHNLATCIRQSLEQLALAESRCEDWTRLLRPLPQLRNAMIRSAAETNERLRDKMWYVADVRTSSHFHDARMIATALRTMGRSKKNSRSRHDTPVRPWSSSKMPSASLHLKSDAQVLEILSAKLDHGGPNKLTDEMARTTKLWMDRQGIENLCVGEERLHKLCMEVRKCVDAVTAAHPLEHLAPGVVSLFAREGQVSRQIATPLVHARYQSQSGSTGTSRLLNLHNNTRSMDAISTTSHTLSSMSSRDYLESRSPTLTTRSSIYSIAATDANAPSSVTSMGTSHTQSAFTHLPSRKAGENGLLHPNSTDRLRDRVTSLLLSDLTSNLFGDGSETDQAFLTGLGLSLVEKHRAAASKMHRDHDPLRRLNGDAEQTCKYDYEKAFARLLRRFSTYKNPATKLACLYDIDRLLSPYMTEQHSNEPAGRPDPLGPSINVKELSSAWARETSEVHIRGFCTIFSKKSLRPTTIFRDLQYIAALTPSSVLQSTAHGRAFANAAVALMAIKHQARVIMVETADSIIAYQSNNRGHERSASLAQQQRDSATFPTPTRSPPIEDVSRYEMSDAAELLQITAKEGDPVAQRELATLYLTHPELMDHIIAPFARPKEVFKEELESKWRRNQDPARCDPITMCVAHHWMSLSSKGGDALAKEYLRQREEMDSL